MEQDVSLFYDQHFSYNRALQSIEPHFLFFIVWSTILHQNEQPIKRIASVFVVLFCATIE